jgi:hypothetical protein
MISLEFKNADILGARGSHSPSTRGTLITECEIIYFCFWGKEKDIVPHTRIPSPTRKYYGQDRPQRSLSAAYSKYSHQGIGHVFSARGSPRGSPIELFRNTELVEFVELTSGQNHLPNSRDHRNTFGQSRS